MNDRIFCIKKEEVFVGKRPAMFEKLKQLDLEVEHETSTRWYIKPCDWIGDTNRKNNDDVSFIDLMFCDQPDEVTHCYYDEGKLYYFNSGERIDEDYLICTREVKPEQSRYEKGELPPVGEVVEGYVQDSSRQWKWLEVEVLKHSEPQHKECAVYVVKHGLLRWCDQFRPIQSERDKLIEAAQAVSGLRARDGAREVAQNFVDAGWRPSND